MSAERPGSEVLVVDDDPAILDSVCEAVAALGHGVRRASDGKEAQDALRGRAPSLLITDFRMPKLDGLALIRWCRQEGMGMPVILMSADLQAPAVVMRWLACGAQSFLRKPFDLDTLRHAMFQAEEGLTEPVKRAV